MKKLMIFICLLLLTGCAHNESMAKIASAQNEAYARAMDDWREAVKSDPGKILEMDVDAGRKLVIYNQNRKLPPMPLPPKEVKTWGAQIADSTSEFGITAIKWGAGLMAIKVITDNAGHNVTTTGSHNQDAHNITTTTDNGIADSYNDSSSSDASTQIADSYNTPTTTNTTTNADSFNTDQSTNDSGWTDDHADNSAWSDDHHSDDNSTNNQDQYSGDSVTNNTGGE